MKYFNKSKNTTPERYSENAQGDFYVENDVCIKCGAPQVEAPDLIDHSKLEYGHCYFKKQPKTEDEIERAIQAIAVSCISGLRYGGTNENILRRLYEIGADGQCDQKPIGNYKTLILDIVFFEFNGSIKALSELITDQITLENDQLNKQIINLEIENDYFEFVNRWTNNSTGNTFKCKYIGENKFQVVIGIEENGDEMSIRENSIKLNSILCSDKRISKIIWIDKDNNTYNETELR